MKRWNFIRAAAFAVAALLAGSASARDDRGAVYREGNRLVVHFTLDGGDLDLKANEQLALQPVLEGRDRSVELPPILFTGRIRDKVERRRERLEGVGSPYPAVFREVVVRRNRPGLAENEVVYEGSLPYERWMAGGRLMLYRTLTGCAGSSLALEPLLTGEIAVPIQPQLLYLIPEDAPKRRSEQITATVHFPQGRSVLLAGFGDNRRQLGRIDSLTRRVYGGDSVTVEEVRLKGYASPEDTYAYNTRLSAARARSLQRYLAERYPIPAETFVLESEPEDWDSLRRWLVVSTFPHRDEVLAVIDTVSDPDARDAGIRAIDGWHTYNRLLREVYPRLRRVDYRISYLLPPYTLDQAARIVAARPERLSVAEMCRLAATYPLDSPERHYVCSVAVEVYPDDACACNNMAMLALRRGDTQLARRCLSRCADDPRVQNNLGVLYLFEGDPERAKLCFSRGAEAGSEEAAYNLANFEWLAVD